MAAMVFSLSSTFYINGYSFAIRNYICSYSNTNREITSAYPFWTLCLATLVQYERIAGRYQTKQTQIIV
jgi:hypothetical protein